MINIWLQCYISGNIIFRLNKMTKVDFIKHLFSDNFPFFFHTNTICTSIGCNVNSYVPFIYQHIFLKLYCKKTVLSLAV